MDNPGIKLLGDRSITAALTDQVITSQPDTTGATQAYLTGLADMGSVTLFAEFVYGSGGTTCIVIVDTSLNQGEDWIEIARFDFATANRVAMATVSGAGPYAVTTLAALGAEGKRDGILGDRLRVRVTSTGTYAGNTSISVRAAVRGAGAGPNAADSLTQYLDGLETLVTALNGYVDGLESGQSGIQSTLTTLAGYVDTLEALIASTNLALGSPMQSSGGSVTLVTQAYSASAAFTPAAASHVAGDCNGAAGTFALMGPSAGRIMITSASLVIAGATAEATAWRLCLFSVTPPSAVADDGAFVLPTGDLASFLGYIDLGTAVDLVDNQYVEVNGINKQVKLAGTSLFGYLVNLTTLTPAAVAHTVTLHSVAL